MLKFFIKNSKKDLHKSDSKEHHSSFINIEETKESMSTIAAVLRGLSMFYAYNANWGEQHLPDEIKSEWTECSIMEKHALSTGTRFGAFSFQLSMPYTQEVNLKHYILISLPNKIIISLLSKLFK